MPMKLIVGKSILENMTLIVNSEGITVMQKSEETITKSTDEANELPDLFLIDGGNNLDIGKSDYLSEIKTIENDNIVLKETLSKIQEQLANKIERDEYNETINALEHEKESLRAEVHDLIGEKKSYKKQLNEFALEIDARVDEWKKK
ncbi:hypothetical protein QE152_g32187 [Popillia japonica]|uniref:Uncharacterized protein n=1 Tax=Popillia japonica TaxID=7064 RepID=A0AAW1IZR5_POPJA